MSLPKPSLLLLLLLIGGLAVAAFSDDKQTEAQAGESGAVHTCLHSQKSSAGSGRDKHSQGPGANPHNHNAAHGARAERHADHDRHTHGHGAGGTMTFKQVMGSLKKHMGTLAESILSEDFAAMEQAAAGIAEHPAPIPAHISIIVKGLGSEVGEFQQADIRVHQTAAALREAARKHNLEEAAVLYHKLFDGCRGCHAGYKQKVGELFVAEQGEQAQHKH